LQHKHTTKMQKDLLTIRSAESDLLKLRASSVAKALHFYNTLYELFRPTKKS